MFEPKLQRRRRLGSIMRKTASSIPTRTDGSLRDGRTKTMDRIRPAEDRGWAGSPSVSREKFVKTVEVSEQVAKDTAAKTGIWLPQQNPQDPTKWRLATLGVRPTLEIDKLRTQKAYSASGETCKAASLGDKQIRGTSLDITAKFLTPLTETQKTGLTLCKSPTGDEQTHISYDASTSQIVVDRPKGQLT